MADAQFVYILNHLNANLLGLQGITAEQIKRCGDIIKQIIDNLNKFGNIQPTPTESDAGGGIPTPVPTESDAGGGTQTPLPSISETPMPTDLSPEMIM